MRAAATVATGGPRPAPPTLPAPLVLLRQRPAPSEEALRAAGFGGLDAVAVAAAALLKLPRLAPDAAGPDPALADAVPRALVERHRVVPVFLTEDELTLATCEPERVEVFDVLGRQLRRRVVPVVATASEVDAAFERLYDRPALAAVEPEPEARVSAQALEEASAVVDRLIARAADAGASDVHLEAAEGQTVVRFRVDGVLRVVEVRPADLHPALVSRIKVLAGLDISERHVPQDGRIKLRRRRGDVDLRVSVLPTYFGEKACLRVLDNTRAAQPLEALGFRDDMLRDLRRMVRAPFGLVLVTGPTGSGKSTTLYAALNSVRGPEVNITTVEDPVEYQLPGINQVQVNPRRGLTFPLALRALLRQDPDVVLVGEVRDRETGAIAAEAALTGHLVLASLHTNDAPSALTRLAEMGVEPWLLAPSLLGVLAQRLVRRVCVECAEPHRPATEELEALGLAGLPEGARPQRGRGCEACQGSGYRGRVAVRELLEVDPGLRTLVGRGADVTALRAHAEARGFRGMRLEALRLMLTGTTTVAEVLRLTAG